MPKRFAFFVLLMPLLVVAGNEPAYWVGVSKIDITPNYPIRLNGYYARKSECDGVLQHIFAKALAIGSDSQGPAILISADNCSIPAAVREEVFEKLKKRHIQSEKLAICVSHTHHAPKLTGAGDTIFGMDIPAPEQAHIDRYTRDFVDKLCAVALAALEDRKPAKLSWAKTSADFAVNRRTKGGPSDHDLPVLKITGTNGNLRALVQSYACHCTTLSSDTNQICGDWAGYAQQFLEGEHPGAIAMVLIGCGGDSNPFPRSGPEFVQQHGQTIANAVNDLLRKPFQPLTRKLECRADRIFLSFDQLPTRAEWEERANRAGPANRAVAYHARKNLARLDRGEKLPTQLPYLVQEWNFGDQLAMVFLSGEVVVDYSLRLKKEFDSSRLWINAYANEVPSYIPSRRILKEGGYEAESAMVYDDLPTRLADSTEDRIIEAVRAVVPGNFRAKTNN